jgi:hypothetical protein
MFVSFAEHVLEFHNWESKNDLLNSISSCDGGTLILGEDASQEVAFYSTVVHYSYTLRRGDVPHVKRWGIGLISEGHGVRPHLITLPDEVIVFGFNQEAVGLNVSQRRYVFRFTFDSVFRSFVYLPDDRLLLIFNEIGVVAVTKDGKEKWRYEKDVITDCLMEHGKLVLRFMDSPTVTIELSSGSVKMYPLSGF